MVPDVIHQTETPRGKQKDPPRDDRKWLSTNSGGGNLTDQTLYT